MNFIVYLLTLTTTLKNETHEINLVLINLSVIM